MPTKTTASDDTPINLSRREARAIRAILIAAANCIRRTATPSWDGDYSEQDLENIRKDLHRADNSMARAGAR